MGAICSFLCLCKQSAKIAEKQEYPVDPAQKQPMGPEETVRYFINPTRNLLSPDIS